MAKVANAYGYVNDKGDEYKLIRNGVYWIVVKRVNYPSGELSFWQQVSKNYVYRLSAFKNMMSRKGSC